MLAALLPTTAIAKCPSSQPSLAGRLAMCLLAVAAFTNIAFATGPFAATIVAQNGIYGAAPYDDPVAILGEPTRIAINNDPLAGTAAYHSKIVEGIYNVDSNGNKLLTTLATSGGSHGSITVQFDQPILDDPANPYGIDLNIFGNTFYNSAGDADDLTDLRTHMLLGGLFAEPVVISVSPDNVNWYTYSSGPYGDTAFPTQGSHWDPNLHDATGNGWNDQPTAFDQPVNPMLSGVLSAGGLSAYDAIGAYVGSGGGTGIDLAASGFASIQYVRVEATSQFSGGEIDALADVRPAHLGESLAITPTDVGQGLTLYFQDPTDQSQNRVTAVLDSLSNHAKVSTAPLTNPSALAALTGLEVLAGYELSVAPLFEGNSLSFQADLTLSAGPFALSSQSIFGVTAWDGTNWNSVNATFDPQQSRILLADWSQPQATIAITRLAGDFNTDGQVNARDYAVWRAGLGDLFASTDFDIWRNHYGAHWPTESPVPASTPEPNALVFCWLALAAMLGCRTRCFTNR